MKCLIWRQTSQINRIGLVSAFQSYPVHTIPILFGHAGMQSYSNTLHKLQHRKKVGRLVATHFNAGILRWEFKGPLLKMRLFPSLKFSWTLEHHIASLLTSLTWLVLILDASILLVSCSQPLKDSNVSWGHLFDLLNYSSHMWHIENRQTYNI